MEVRSCSGTNLKDSGLKVIIGQKTAKVKSLRKRWFEVYETSEAVKRADIIQILIPMK